MPHLGVSVEDATVANWLKAEGDAVVVDEPLLEIATDKVDTEVLSPAAGTLARILVAAGETVPVGTVVAEIAGEGDSVPREAAAPAPAPSSGAKLISPVVARMVSEHSLDVGSIAGTGKNGRISKKDVLAALAAPGATAAPAPAAPAKIDAPAAERPLATTESTEPLSPMRRSIGEHMRRSLDTAPHAMSATEVDMTSIRTARAALKREYEERHGVNPTYLAFVAHATVATLNDYPWINAEIRGDQIVTKQSVNLGIAVEVEEGKGLLVPVIHHAETLNLLGMASAIADLARRARERKTRPDDLHGGTFTITNPGGFGVTGGTPIINQPQSAILGTYAVVDRPWAVRDTTGQPTLGIRPIMNLSLTYDHRLVDGAYAGRFLRDLRARLEGWTDER
jgi:2-oxoglutarate dehydrogenase E2 component (dihydrolipoamide succinyltransferase)